MDIISLLNSRKSIRKYTAEEIPDNLLNDLFTAASRASTTGNMQVYSVVVTKNLENKKLLAPHHFNQKMVTEAPVVLTINADFNRFNKWCELRKAKPGYDNFLSFMTAAIDALLFAQNFCVAAESKGLGICYLGTTIYNADKIIEALKLPRGVVPITTLTVGFPAESPDLVDRLPLEGLVHYEQYNDYTPEMIDQIYFQKENLDETARLLEENQMETLAQILAHRRYTKETNEVFSEKLINVLKTQGFLNL